MDELKEMQSQLDALKNTLSKSRIANDRLMKKVIKQKARAINLFVWTQCISLPIIMLILIAFCVGEKVNLWLAWSFGIAALVDSLFDFRTLRISTRDLSRETMLQVKNKLLTQKKERRIQYAVTFPLVTCWMIWFFYSVFKVFDIPIELKPVLISIFVVIIISAIGLTFCLTKKFEASTRDMISDIEELTV